MDMIGVRFEKTLAENKILDEIKKIVSDFESKAIVSVSGISINMLEITRVGDKSQYIVHDVSIDIAI